MTPDTVVFNRADCLSIDAMIINSQMRWSGHIVRMEDDRLPKQLFYGELKNGKRLPHKPKKRYKDCIKDNLKVLGVNIGDWEVVAEDRVGWRYMIKEGCSAFEKKRINHADLKRATRKGKVAC